MNQSLKDHQIDHRPDSVDSAGKAPPPLSLWQRTRGGIFMIAACLASPCCTPLYVPLLLALLAGTPVALWISAHLGWIYGGLTALSLISLVLGIGWMRQGHPSGSRHNTPQQDSRQPIQLIENS